LGRALDWVYEHDPTTLFAGLAMQARQRFGIKAKQVHIDTTSFSVNGEYVVEEKTNDENRPEEEAVPIAITYGYSRDHRADLKQWMLGLVTTHDGDVPIFLRPLDGNSGSPKRVSVQSSSM
jgi:transposase